MLSQLYVTSKFTKMIETVLSKHLALDIPEPNIFRTSQVIKILDGFPVNMIRCRCWCTEEQWRVTPAELTSWSLWKNNTSCWERRTWRRWRICSFQRQSSRSPSKRLLDAKISMKCTRWRSGRRERTATMNFDNVLNLGFQKIMLYNSNRNGSMHGQTEVKEEQDCWCE